MKIIDMRQNTPEWLSYRRSKIGASDAPIIMSVSPYTTRYQLYESKTMGKDKSKNIYMQRGHDLEQEARSSCEDIYSMLYMDEIHLSPMVAQSSEHDWMIASLDGIDLAKKIAVEIKCPGPKDHQTAVNGKIPAHYIPQLQHQMAVTGYDSIYYYSYRTEDGANPVMIECKRDNAYIDTLIAAEKDFYNLMTTKTPPEASSMDCEEIIDTYFLEIAKKYEIAKAEAEEKNKEETELKNKLIELSKGKNCMGGNIKITHTARRGAIDYSKIDQLRGVDLEAYRKPSTNYTTVTIRGQSSCAP